jgi:hypothetical protein
LLHPHSSIYHPHYVIFFSQYFSFPLSVPFHNCFILIHPSVFCCTKAVEMLRQSVASLSPRRPQSQSQNILCNLWCKNWHWDNLLTVSLFPCPIITAPIFHPHLHLHVKLITIRHTDRHKLQKLNAAMKSRGTYNGNVFDFALSGLRE